MSHIMPNVVGLRLVNVVEIYNSVTMCTAYWIFERSIICIRDIILHIVKRAAKMLSTLFLDGENAAELLGGLDYAYLFSYAFGMFLR